MNASNRSTIILEGAYLWAQYMNAPGDACAEQFAAWEKFEGRWNAERPEFIHQAQAVQARAFDWALAN